MVKKSEVRKVADKLFDACKSAGVKKLRIRAAESYAGLSEGKKFNTKFMNKTFSRPVRVSDMMEQIQVDLVDLSSQRVEYGGKVFRYVLSYL